MGKASSIVKRYAPEPELSALEEAKEPSDG